jgi:ElaB/YqjD/DUF883 family membrane-anchored ribosome-binding protein
MSRTPPVPEANQSPFPVAEPPHGDTGASTSAGEESVVDQASAQFDRGVTAARDAAGPLVDKAKTFVKERPWTAAALIGSIGLAVFNSLRGKRP